MIAGPKIMQCGPTAGATLAKGRATSASAFVIIVALFAVLLVPTPVFAQYQGHNFKGDFGVNSGSQPAPGVYLLAHASGRLRCGVRIIRADRPIRGGRDRQRRPRSHEIQGGVTAYLDAAKRVSVATTAHFEMHSMLAPQP